MYYNLFFDTKLIFYIRFLEQYTCFHILELSFFKIGKHSGESNFIFFVGDLFYLLFVCDINFYIF